MTSGGIEVLEIYKRVGVQEVWFWEDGEISVYALADTDGEVGDEQVECSGLYFLMLLKLDISLTVQKLPETFNLLR